MFLVSTGAFPLFELQGNLRWSFFGWCKSIRPPLLLLLRHQLFWYYKAYYFVTSADFPLRYNHWTWLDHSLTTKQIDQTVPNSIGSWNAPEKGQLWMARCNGDPRIQWVSITIYSGIVSIGHFSSDQTGIKCGEPQGIILGPLIITINLLLLIHIITTYKISSYNYTDYT